MEIQNMKETELCLGIPGRTKRAFSETHDSSSDDFNLMLHIKLPSHKPSTLPSPSSKPPPAKAQVVGWPPVRTHRQNVMKTHKSKSVADAAAVAEETSFGGAFVKVSIDGAPYLRKLDLKMYKSYQELSDALANLFSSFAKVLNEGNDGEDGTIDFMNGSKLRDTLNSLDYIKTYQDKDGDWMLVGDVPWEMFVDSCKRLRIVKRSEAKGHAPEHAEKSK